MSFLWIDVKESGGSLTKALLSAYLRRHFHENVGNFFYIK